MMMLIALLGLAAWVFLVTAHWGFWRADQRLPRAPEPLAHWPAVTAIVPARNEASTIAQCVTALLAQDYPGAFQVIVVDDHSSDGTGDLARGAAGDGTRRSVLTAPDLEAGWTGKLWALNAGLAAVEGDPEYLWFTDADVVHAPATLRRLVARAETAERDLVSLMVRLHCETFWEKLVIPAFVFFFQMLYPFAAVNDDRSATAAAAGGCVLLRRAALTRAGGLGAIRNAVIDDCALAGIVKKAGGRLWLGLADDSYSLRAASGLASLWDMVRRTAFTQLRYSYALLAGTTVAMMVIFVAPPLIVLASPWRGIDGATVVALFAWLLMAAAFRPTAAVYRLPWAGLALPVSAALYSAMTVDSGLAHWRGRGGAWKGRYYGG